MVASGLSEIAARRQLTRLAPLVTRVTKRQAFFIIVDPEFELLGAPPPAWWLDDYFAWLKHPYYLALQSAAAEYGSAAQAVQVTQVMTDEPRRPVDLGRVRVQFFVKAGIRSTPTQTALAAFAPLAVATPAATVLDLLQYASRIGGIERATETLLPLLPKLTVSDLTNAMAGGADSTTLKRLEHLLEASNRARLARAVRACVSPTPHVAT